MLVKEAHCSPLFMVGSGEVSEGGQRNVRQSSLLWKTGSSKPLRGPWVRRVSCGAERNWISLTRSRIITCHSTRAMIYHTAWRIDVQHTVVGGRNAASIDFIGQARKNSSKTSFQPRVSPGPLSAASLSSLARAASSRSRAGDMACRSPVCVSMRARTCVIVHARVCVEHREGSAD